MIHIGAYEGTHDWEIENEVGSNQIKRVKVGIHYKEVAGTTCGNT